jgi:hypothetical protein
MTSLRCWHSRGHRFFPPVMLFATIIISSIFVIVIIVMMIIVTSTLRGALGRTSPVPVGGRAAVAGPGFLCGKQRR